MSPGLEKISVSEATPLVSIIILNYNGAQWLTRCIESLGTQTILKQLEVILVDNNSSDDSVAVARPLLAKLPAASILKNSENLGFCAGNNSGARVACGKYLFFLNNDTWLEPECMERLVTGTEELGAVAATPMVLNYPDDSFQDFGFYGFDIFGLPSPSDAARQSREIFIPGGCAYLIRRDVFERVGEFDAAFFIYSDDADLAWRLAVAGHTAAGVVPARLHHRGAAGVNPAGGIQTLEFRTTDKKRYLSNRNCLLTILKNAEHFLLVTVPLQIALLFIESLVGAFILRRWSFVRASFWEAVRDCWRMRRHVLAERKRIAQFRQRSDFAMLRFLRWKPNRWFEIKRLFQFGLPKVDAR
jgi:GT2 family glycosyltransferase